MKKDNLLAIVTAFLLLCSLGPYFTWGLFRLGNYFPPFLKVVIAFLLWLRRDVKSPQDKYARILFIITTSLYVLLAIIHVGTSFVGVIDCMLAFLLILQFETRSDYAHKVYNCFTDILSFLLVLSIVSWLLHYFGVSPYLGTILSNDADRVYAHYPFCVIESLDVQSIRFYGIFDEPGALGTIVGILLCINKFDLKDRRNIIFLISGIISFSFFFYIIAAFYWVSILLLNKKFLTCIFVLSGIALFYHLTKDNDIIYTTIWERFEWDSDTNSFKGDDRMANQYAAEAYYDDFKGSSDLFFGVADDKEFKSLAEGASSYKLIVVSHGIVFLILYILSFCLLAKAYRKMGPDFLLYCVAFISCIYQRAAIYSVGICFLWVYYAKYSTRTQILKA